MLRRRQFRRRLLRRRLLRRRLLRHRLLRRRLLRRRLLRRRLPRRRLLRRRLLRRRQFRLRRSPLRDSFAVPDPLRGHGEKGPREFGPFSPRRFRGASRRNRSTRESVRQDLSRVSRRVRISKNERAAWRLEVSGGIRATAVPAAAGHVARAIPSSAPLPASLALPALPASPASSASLASHSPERTCATSIRSGTTRSPLRSTPGVP